MMFLHPHYRGRDGDRERRGGMQAGRSELRLEVKCTPAL